MNYFDMKEPSLFAKNHLYHSDGLGIISDKNFYIPWRTAKNYLLLYVEEGLFHIDQKDHYQVKAGEILVMDLSKYHRYYSDKDKPCLFKWMHFASQPTNPLMAYLNPSFNSPYIYKHKPTINNLENCLAASKEKDPQRAYIYDLNIHQFLNHLMCVERTKEDSTNRSQKALFTQKINTYIDQHIEDQVTLEHFAKSCGFSKYHFTKLCNQYLGQSPMKYLYSQKIHYAKNLLLHTHVSIGSIAMSLGFDTPSHFSTYFKKMTNTTPTAYRKTQ